MKTNLVDVDLEGENAGEELLAVPDHHRVRDARQLLLDGLLDQHRRHVLAARRDDQLLYPARDGIVPLLILKVVTSCFQFHINFYIDVNIRFYSNEDHIQGEHSDFANFNSGVLPVCPFAMPSLPNFHSAKQNWADRGTNQIQVNKTWCQTTMVTLYIK